MEKNLEDCCSFRPGYEAALVVGHEIRGHVPAVELHPWNAQKINLKNLIQDKNMLRVC